MTGRISGTSIRAWRNSVVLLFALGGISISAWGPRLPSIQGHLHVGTGLIGLVLAGVTIGSLSGLVMSSALLARFGPRRAIAGSGLLIAVGLGTVGLGAGGAGSLAVTVVGFALVGLGLGTLDIMINVEGSAVERTAKKTLMPLMHAGWSVGAIIGSAIGVVASAIGVSFEWQFVAEAVVIGVAAVVVTRFLPAAVEVDDADRPPLRARVRLWLRGWADPRLILIGAVMLGVELGEGTSNNWLTLAVRDDHHQTETVAALFLTIFAVGESAARIFGGPLVDRVGRVRAVRVTTAIGVVGLLLFILGGPVWVIVVGTVLWAVGVSMGFPLGMSAAADSGPNPAARVSVVASIGYLANLGGPPVIGLLAEKVGLLGSFWLVIVLLAVGFAAAGALRPPSRGTAEINTAGRSG